MSTQNATGAYTEISRLVGGIEALPTPPIVFTQIQSTLNDPSASAYDMAAILQEDAAMSAKVLRLTNSAYYGLTRTIESVKQAVVLVGVEAVKNLVLSASVFEMFSEKQIDREFQDYFWRHSLATAFGARLLARKLETKVGFDPEAGFSGGLLHDIGKMVISVYMTDARDKIKELKEQKPDVPDHAIEGEILGYNHSQIGATLGDKWQLPSKLIETIEFHHFPQTTPTADNTLPYLIHMADYLSKLAFEVDPGEEEPQIEPMQDEVMDLAGVTEEDVVRLIQSVREEYTKAETFMAMARGLG